MYETRKKNLAASARKLKARLDDIQARAKNRDLTYSEMREAHELKSEADKLYRQLKSIQADEEIENIMNDMGKGTYQGKTATPRENKAAFNFSEKDLETFHNAARRRTPYKLISRDESPMSNRLEYSLPPYEFLRGLV
jgi:hypothetical protein